MLAFVFYLLVAFQPVGPVWLPFVLSSPDLTRGQPEPTVTETATPTPTETPQPTATSTVAPSATQTPTAAPTVTATPSPTVSPTASPTAPPTQSAPTATNTPTPTPTATMTAVPTATPTTPAVPIPSATPTSTATATTPPTPLPLRRMAVRLRDFDNAEAVWHAGIERTYDHGTGYECLERQFYTVSPVDQDYNRRVISIVCRYVSVALADQAFDGDIGYDINNGFYVDRPFAPLAPTDRAAAGNDLQTQFMNEYWYTARVGRMTFFLSYYGEGPLWALQLQCELATLRRLTNPDAEGVCNLE